MTASSEPGVCRRDTLWVCLGLALVTLLAYWPVTGYDFVGYDDTDYVTQNPQVQAGLSARSLAWVWRSEVARNWHPVTMLSHMLDCQWHGLHAGWHHLTNLLLHTANTVLWFILLRRISGALWRSAAVAALFALHPLHVESVAWVAERKDVLSTFFGVLTLWAYVGYVQQSKTRSLKSKVCYALALGCFVLGLMSKPMLVTLPFVMLLLDYWPLARLRLKGLGRNRTKHSSSQASAKQRWGSTVCTRTTGPAFPGLAPINSPLSTCLEKFPFVALAAGSCIITFLVQQRGGAVQTMSALPLAARLENALMSYVRYLGKMVWPEHLAALYLWPRGWALWQVILGTLFLFGVTATVLWQGYRRPYLAVGWFWYVGTLVPVIGLVQVGMQTMADRYTYIPLVGIFIILAWGGCELAQRWQSGRTALVALAASVLAVCGVLTREQLGYWKDGETLLKRMVSATPGNYLAHYNLGNLYDRQGKLAEAIRQYEAALRDEPNYADAHNNLGGVLLRQHHYDEALVHYEAAARIYTDCVHLFNLANALADAGRLAQATAAYQQCLHLNSGYVPAHLNLGLAWQAQGKPSEAAAEFRNVLALEPTNESAQYSLADRLAEAGQTAEAIVHYQAAERLNPQRAESYNGLGICYAMQGRMAEAEAQFRESLRLNARNPGAESNLGNALGAQNRLAEAIPHYQRALELNPGDYQTHFNLALSLMRQGQVDQARRQLQEALRLHPDYPEAQRALAGLKGPQEKQGP